MKALKVNVGNDVLLDPFAGFWSSVTPHIFNMMATPLAMVANASPFLARSQDHGAVQQLTASAVHNGNAVAIRLEWACERHAEIRDLNQFVDGVAVLFPLSRTAYAITMGAKDNPVNAWFWRANNPLPFEVVAEGFADVRRQPQNDRQDLRVRAEHREGRWHLVFRRSLGKTDQGAALLSGRSSKIAFAVWDGGNAERSGRKSFSGEFIDFELA